jgi:hypothetical protein
MYAADYSRFNFRKSANIGLICQTCGQKIKKNKK